MSIRKISTIMLPSQCRAARALLGITQSELAEAAETGMKTIADFERGADRGLHVITLRVLRNALESAGMEFIDTDGKNPGVRLKKPSKGAASKNDSKIITPELCRAARELLYISQQQLSDLSKIPRRTIADFERRMERKYGETILITLRTTLEKSGIAFIFPNGGGPGVRLKSANVRIRG